MFPEFFGPIGCILKFVVLGNHRHFEFKKCRNKTVSSLVEQNRDYCSFNNKITIMMYLFTVPPGTFITLSEFCVEFYVKVHFYNPYDSELTVAVRKHFFTDSNFQTPISEIMTLFTRLTVAESREEIEEREEDKVFYHLLNSEGVACFYSNAPVQVFVQRHRERLPHHNRITVTIHAFYIEKVD